jgi:LmbE family N-acetylglucosaminyl deacetylase
MSILAIGAHPDDVELGCGGTLLRAHRCGVATTVLVLTDGARGAGGPGVREAEQRRAAMRLGADLVLLNRPDGQLSVDAELVGCIEQVIADTGAQLILTHADADSHQDHRAAAAATVAAARSHSQILHYESPSTLEFTPTVFSDITGFVDAKQDLLRSHISQVTGSQRVDLDAMAAQARFRGFQGRLTEAEAFIATRTLVSLVADPPRPRAIPGRVHARRTTPGR